MIENITVNCPKCGKKDLQIDKLNWSGTLNALIRGLHCSQCDSDNISVFLGEQQVRDVKNY